VARGMRFAAVLMGVAVWSGVTGAATVDLPRERYLDKCRGAWAGQMIGVCFADRYEFRAMGAVLEGPLEPWRPEYVQRSLGQDDCYVEMTFLKALQGRGLDITPAEAGRAFAASEYSLWHANQAGRENVRRGILPPASGHPRNNAHADDIDFQIESDLLGIVCPGLPRESNRLCDVFGHIMNYGDGVYGGMFMAGMYAAAYFEDDDVRRVVEAGLGCIPARSAYRRCVEDVLRWHDTHPDDWRAAWALLEAKWQDDRDCMPGQAFNIDAKLNGAYVVLGLLYGGGDLARTLEVATRCGQDADCNASSAAGVLCCMKGYAALGEAWTGGIPAIENEPFTHTPYTFATLVPACQAVAEAIIARAGGRVTPEGYCIPRQGPRPTRLEQWRQGSPKPGTALSQADVDAWQRGWKGLACGPEMEPGLRASWGGRDHVLVVHPVSQAEPAVLARRVRVPATGSPELVLDVASDPRGDYVLGVVVDGMTAREVLIDTKGSWARVAVDLRAWRGRRVTIRLENQANGWAWEAAYLAAPVLR